MSKTDAKTFADLIEEARKTPSAPGLGELYSPFGAPLPREHRVVNEDPEHIKGLPEFDYKAHVRYFALPQDAPEYEAILNDALAGRCIIRKEESTFTKEGDYIVVVTYMTKSERPRRALRRREEA